MNEKGKKPDYKSLGNKTVGWKDVDKNGEPYISIKIDMGVLGFHYVSIYKSTAYVKTEDQKPKIVEEEVF